VRDRIGSAGDRIHNKVGSTGESLHNKFDGIRHRHESPSIGTMSQGTVTDLHRESTEQIHRASA
jgi:hypothetical protein